MQDHCKRYLKNYSFLKSSLLIQDGGNFNFEKLKSMGKGDVFIHCMGAVMMLITRGKQFRSKLTMHYNIISRLSQSDSKKTQFSLLHH